MNDTMSYHNFTSTDKMMFCLLKASLFEDEALEMEDGKLVFEDGKLVLEDGKLVFEEMKRQTVATLAGEWLKKHPLQEVPEWSAFCTRQQCYWVKVMYLQDQLLKLLEENGIPCVILKGAAAAMAYPHPSLRTMGDVDFMVKRADFEKTAALLERSGYQLTHDKNPKIHHYGYAKDGVDFELHKRLGIVRETDEKLLSVFEQGIDRREFRTLEGFSFPVLPEDLNGLVLLFHVNQHLRSGLGLRQIIDWMMYRSRLPESCWQEQLLPMLREIGLERLAMTVNEMCRKYLGFRTAGESYEENSGIHRANCSEGSVEAQLKGHFEEKTADYPCDELMAYILEKGNFGRKTGVKGRAASFVLSTQGSSSFFRRLQRGGMNNWKAAKKHKVLRPFAWAYQVGHITRTLVKNGMGPGVMNEQRQKGLEQRKLIAALGLDIDRNLN